ncbi:MAG: 3-dehydroquinate synthase [Pseudomonadota bacterium]
MRDSRHGSPAPLPAVSKTIVLVGLMGAGKSSIGRRLAQRLGVPFVDADREIEAAAGASVEEIFERLGESAFRDGERKVIARLLDAPVQVMAAGGGAFMDPEIRARVKRSTVSVWLRADLDLLVRRVSRRTNRPLLKRGDPRQILDELMRTRYPVYAEADIHVDSFDGPPEVTLERVIDGLRRHEQGREAARLVETGSSAAARVRVDLGARGYDIVVGRRLFERAGEFLAPVLRAGRVFVVTDERVAAAQWPRLEAGFEAAGLSVSKIVMPHGETTKDVAHLARLLDDLLDRRPERNDMVLALGGGVIGDLAGLAASLLLRGVDVVQAPTTLLAQVDSAVGGKTAINTSHGKNLIGTFHQPRLVLADLDALSTLPERELRAGYAEAVKYGLIDDADFFAWLESNGRGVIDGDAATRQYAVVKCCHAKARIVGQDERESGPRALLNLGHTFGHALEAGAGFGDRLLHGEAVAIGLVMAFDLSARLGLCAGEDAARVRRHLAAVGLPTAPERGSCPAERLMELMAQDKKVRDGHMNFVLARGIGRAFVAHDVDPAAVRALIERGAAA